jgi:hypothetical protein
MPEVSQHSGMNPVARASVYSGPFLLVSAPVNGVDTPPHGREDTGASRL